MRRRRRDVRWLLCLAGSLLWAGCGIYLHDEGLQKQTDALLATYKTADVAGAVKASIAAQVELDRSEIQAVVDNDAAERDRAVADLITSYPVYGKGQAIERLERRVSSRIDALATRNAPVTFDEWLGMDEKRVQKEALVDSTRRTVAAFQRRYVAAGGKDFKSCDTFAGAAADASDALKTAGRQLKTQCDALKELTAPTDAVKVSLDRVFAAGGEIGLVHQDLLTATQELSAATGARDQALRELQDAREALRHASGDDRAIGDEVAGKLKALDDALKRIDAAAGALGADHAALGQALAAIQFRKNNLREVLAASTADTATGPAAETKRAIVGLIAGVITLSETGKAPSAPALSIALAYQDGLEKAANVRLAALAQRKALLEDQESALIRELELLTVARQAIGNAKAGLSADPCAPKGFVDVFQNTSCESASRVAGARALTAYYLSWATGRTAARVADRKISQLIAWQSLRTSQEVAIARSNIQLIALSELTAYGQGGIKPETIAAFLQAFGVAAIAGGVY